MRPLRFVTAAAVLATAFLVVSFAPVRPTASPAFIDHYSVDPLPESWKQNKSLVQAVDRIITTSVKELEQSIACTDCRNAPYHVSLLIDTPVITRQVYEDIGNKRKKGGYNYECVTDFKFKSYLAVYDISEHGIAKVMINNPEEDKYSITRKFNLYYKSGTGKLTPEEYIAQNAGEIGPSTEELMKFAEKKIYRLRDEIHKLYNRH